LQARVGESALTGGREGDFAANCDAALLQVLDAGEVDGCASGVNLEGALSEVVAAAAGQGSSGFRGGEAGDLDLLAGDGAGGVEMAEGFAVGCGFVDVDGAGAGEAGDLALEGDLGAQAAFDGAVMPAMGKSWSSGKFGPWLGR